MLVLSRKAQEAIVIDNEITVTVLEVRGNHIRIGIEAPTDVAIRRRELTLSAAAPLARSREKNWG